VAPMFASLNAWLGFPERIYCESEFTLQSLISYYNGKRPCFKSVHRFVDRNTPLMDRIVFDFDSDLGWRIPYKEVKKLQDFCKEKEIDYRVVCSGGKGFHFYIMFKEEPMTDLSNSKVYSVQHSLKKYFNLQSTDEPLFAKKGLLIRIPTTKHVALNKKTNLFEDNGNYCRYLSPEDFEKGLDHIEQLIKEPGEMPPHSTTTRTLDEIVQLTPEYKFRDKKDGSLNIDLNPGGVLTPTLESIGLPCLKEVAKSSDPCYADRLELASWLKLQGYRDMAITAFFRECKWQNFNVGKTMTILTSIKPRFPKCSYLRERYPKCESCSFKK